jgi:hypothetical protein
MEKKVRENLADARAMSDAALAQVVQGQEDAHAALLINQAEAERLMPVARASFQRTAQQQQQAGPLVEASAYNAPIGTRKLVAYNDVTAEVKYPGLALPFDIEDAAPAAAAPVVYRDHDGQKDVYVTRPAFPYMAPPPRQEAQRDETPLVPTPAHEVYPMHLLSSKALPRLKPTTPKRVYMHNNLGELRRALITAVPDALDDDDEKESEAMATESLTPMVQRMLKQHNLSQEAIVHATIATLPGPSNNNKDGLRGLVDRYLKPSADMLKECERRRLAESDDMRD